MDEKEAARFAHDWVTAWNSRDLDRILVHYRDDVCISSPFIQSIAGADGGVLRGKIALREYWKTALGLFKDLHFELFNAYPGVRSLVIHYRSVAGNVGAEFMRLDENGFIAEVHAHYSPETKAESPDRSTTGNHAIGSWAMPVHEIEEVRRIFISRLDTLDHLLTVAHAHAGDLCPLFSERLAPDMLPLGTQIAFACNQPNSFSRWCQGLDDCDLDPEVPSLDQARTLIESTRSHLRAIQIDDSLLERVKYKKLGNGLFCELPGRKFVSEFLLPNLYFHVSMTYAIFRRLGVPFGKADYMQFLMPLVRRSLDAR